jgi:hypothetical protein
MPVHVESPTFEFWGCSEIRESLGQRADSVRHLLERLETVPVESIYYHTVRCLLRRRVVAKTYPDDFSIWVATEARDLALAERLSFHTPFDFPDGEAFRQHLLETIDDHLLGLRFAPPALVEKPFYFLRGHLAAVPLEMEASDLDSFRLALARVDDSSLYYHAVEAIGRLEDPRGDFAAWVEDVLGLSSLGREIAQIDPFVMSLAGIRARILALIGLHQRREAGS